MDSVPPAVPALVRLCGEPLSGTSSEIQREGSTAEGFFRKVLEQRMDLRDSHRKRGGTHSLGLNSFSCLIHSPR